MENIIISDFFKQSRQRRGGIRNRFKFHNFLILKFLCVCHQCKKCKNLTWNPPAPAPADPSRFLAARERKPRGSREYGKNPETKYIIAGKSHCVRIDK